MPGPAESHNGGEPATPRPSASIVLLRRGGKHSERALEVLMLKRSEQARFMPGVWVFPGGAVDAADGEGEQGRRACAMRELAEESGIELPAGEELALFSRWITPERVSTRFDAWFFLALAPAHTPPVPDGVETTEAAWYRPGDALEANEAGELPIVFPTVKQLQLLAPHRTADDALAAFRGREVTSILPKFIGEGTEMRPVLPGEPGYPD
ncbi:MAG: NUDIX hydrolase [Thermoleophilia bacterium]|nr:NUDIX hydrolase [Thermoleophilia bacterium]